MSELALTGAQAIVKLMVTDAWDGAKKLVARVFSSRSDPARQEMLQSLDSARLELAADKTVDRVRQKHEEDRLEALLRLRLVEDPAVANFIREILQFAQSKDAMQADGASRITLNAEAKDNARIYQQGSGTQHNS